MEIAGSREFLTVTLSGTKATAPIRFHVDTGGNTEGLLLNLSTAERLGFSSEEAMPRTLHIGGRDVPVPDGANWILYDDSGDDGKADWSIDKNFSEGQIGSGFLSRFVVCIDPAKGRFGLGDPKRYDIEPGDQWVPLFMLPSRHPVQPFVHVVLRDHGNVTGDYGMLLDTGATTSMLERNAIDDQHKQHLDWATANGAFGDADMLGGRWVEEVIRADDVALDSPAGIPRVRLEERVTIDMGPATFVDRPTGTFSKLFGDVSATMGSHGAIANDVLLRFRLLIDYPHGRLFVEPSARPVDASASSSRIGVAVVFGADGCPEIRRLTDTNAKGTLANLKVGDVIVSVDGENLCALPHHALSAALAGPPGTHKKIGIRRAGAKLDVDAVTAELLK